METGEKKPAREDWCGYQKKWYEANKSKILAKKRHRYKTERAHKTVRYIDWLNYGAAWRAEHPEYQQRYRAENEEDIREYRRLRRLSGLEKVLNSSKQPCDH